jgi:hypothetical protein
MLNVSKKTKKNKKISSQTMVKSSDLCSGDNAKSKDTS